MRGRTNQPGATQMGQMGGAINQMGHMGGVGGGMTNQMNAMNPNQPYYGQTQQQLQQQQQQQNPLQSGVGGPRNPGQQQQIRGPQTRGQMNQQQQQQQQKKARFFLAMFDYDPSTMSPNPDGCEEELPFQEGDTIKVGKIINKKIKCCSIQMFVLIFQIFGDKDPDGFYWGELRGRRGYVPHNMVTEIDENQAGAQGGVVGGVGGGGVPGTSGAQSVRGISRDRWGDIYANTPVKRMVALYDYDPQELSPNVDAEVNVNEILSIESKPILTENIFYYFFFNAIAASRVDL